MGFIQELPDDKYDRKYGDLHLFKRLFGYIAIHDKKTFLSVLIWMILQTGASIGIPFFIRFVIEGVQNGNFDTVFYVESVAIIFLYAVFWFAQYRALYKTSILMGEMLRRVRKDSFETLLKNDMKFYDENKSGKLVSRVTSDSDTISQMVQITTSFMINILVMIVVLVILFLTNLKLALITLAVVPVLFGLGIGIRLFSRRTSKNWRKTIAILNANVAESITDLKVSIYVTIELHMLELGG